jgi:integrase
VKHWTFRYVRDGRMREMGLGAAHGRDAVSLSDARKTARELWDIHKSGRDPLVERRAGRMAIAAAAIGSGRTFKQAAEEFIELHRPSWRNVRHAGQWETTLAHYAYPIIGAMSVDVITTTHVAAVLTSIWTSIPETASRVRGRIEQVLGREKGLGHRTGENPAAWKHNLDAVLPRPAKLKRVKNLAAMPARDVGDFMERLRADAGVAARALEFAILNASRTDEVRLARWSEIDFGERLWIVPAERMKAEREHRVPLANRSLEILFELAKAGDPTGDGFVFPGSRPGRPLTAGALLEQMRSLGETVATVHGTSRSTFRDWVSESTNFPGEVAELALAHNVGDATERSYRRGDQLAKRFQLAEAWAAFCAKPSIKNGGDKVVAIRGGAK